MRRCWSSNSESLIENGKKAGTRFDSARKQTFTVKYFTLSKNSCLAVHLQKDNATIIAKTVITHRDEVLGRWSGTALVKYTHMGLPSTFVQLREPLKHSLLAAWHIHRCKREQGWTFGLIQQYVCTCIHLKKKNYIWFESPKSQVCVSL